MPEKLTLIDNDKIISKTSGPWERLVFSIVESCPKIKKEREKKILYARFGIGESPKTLDAIGKTLGITRERIRQIVGNTLRKIQKSCLQKEVTEKIAKIEEFIQKNGGYVTNSDLFERFTHGETSEQNAVRLIACLSKDIEILKESNTLKGGWNGVSLKQSEIKNLSEKIVKFLKDSKKILSTAEIQKEIKKETKVVACILLATKAVMKTDNNRWGLSVWPNVNPKSIRDKSKYIVLRHGKPIHYTELAKKISDLGEKKVTKQSVHNELIKSEEFILVGRGIYALAEWGYRSGVVEEVIVEVLEEAGQPLHKNDIVKKVLERRIVKSSTIVLNLQKSRFKRVGKAIYALN